MDDFLQIGNTLRSARESLDLSIQDATHKTRIPQKILLALESDDYSVFSSSTYARSYLLQYSKYLNLDPSPWLDAFEPTQFSHDGYSFPVINEFDVRETNQRPKSQHPARFLPTLLGLALVVAVLYTGYKVIGNFQTVVPNSTDSPQNSANQAEQQPDAASSAKEKLPPVVDDEPLTVPPRAIAIPEED